MFPSSSDDFEDELSSRARDALLSDICLHVDSFDSDLADDVVSISVVDFHTDRCESESDFDLVKSIINWCSVYGCVTGDHVMAWGCVVCWVLGVMALVPRFFRFGSRKAKKCCPCHLLAVSKPIDSCLSPPDELPLSNNLRQPRQINKRKFNFAIDGLQLLIQRKSSCKSESIYSSNMSGIIFFYAS